MITNFLAIVTICLLSLNLSNLQQPIAGIKLIDGYKYKDGFNVDTLVGTIYKEGGLTIDIECGLAGVWANPKDRSKYAWYKEQLINGHKVIIALIKPGIKTVWEPEKARNGELGNILLITIPLGRDPDYAANFKAEILNPEEMVEMILMVLTFDPSKM